MFVFVVLWVSVPSVAAMVMAIVVASRNWCGSIVFGGRFTQRSMLCVVLVSFLVCLFS